jgi:hypothetical protein
MRPFRAGRSIFFVPCAALAALLVGGTGTLTGMCGPFTDVTDPVFCNFILEIYYLGVTAGTTPTTYDPSAHVTRLQMAAFLSREADRVLQRSSRRAALDQFWTPQDSRALKTTSIGVGVRQVRSDGADLWAASQFAGGVSRIRGSDGTVLGVWGAASAYGVLVAAGRVFVTGSASPGALYRIDPREPPGAATTVASNLGDFPLDIAYDGSRIWTANGGASVSIVTPGATLPWTVTTVTVGFAEPFGTVFDGGHIWVSDFTAGTLLKLDGAGAILQTVTVGLDPHFPVFDGTNIWGPNGDASVSVVRADSGAVLATLTGNGLGGPNPAFTAAFDGQRVLVTSNGISSVSLWKAADLTPLGSFGTGTDSQPFGACSDGINFWITLNGTSQLARF